MALPQWMNSNRKTIRQAPNPMDKSTIVSIYPKMVDEVKHTIFPGRFTINAGSFEKPAILVVGSSSWWRMTEQDDHILEIPTGSMQVAKSVVQDYTNGLLGYSNDSCPGLFFLPGELTINRVILDHKKELNIAKAKQDTWYRKLVQMADSLWARTNGNPLSISDDARMAAEVLGLAKEKPWMQDFATLQKVHCPACGFLVMGDFPVCSNCKTVIDTKKFETLGLKFAS